MKKQSEQERIEEQFRPDKRAARFAAQIAISRLPPNRKRLAVERFLQAGEETKAVVDVALAAFDALTAPKKLTHRRYMSGLGQRLYGLTHKFGPADWPEQAALAAARQILRGTEERTVLAVVAACCRHLGRCATDEEQAALQARVQEITAHPPEPRAPAPKPAGSAATTDHICGDELAKEMEDCFSLEKVQRASATQQLRQAMMLLKPWVKRIVVARMAYRQSYADIAKQCDSTVDEVTRMLSAARQHIRHYTTFFDDDWYWADVPPTTCKTG